MKIGPYDVVEQVANKPPSFQGSQWQKYYLLLETNELEILLATLSDVELFHSGSVLPLEEFYVSKNLFLEIYKNALKDLTYLSPISFFATSDSKSFVYRSFGDGRGMLHTYYPVLQIQAHAFAVSFDQKRFFPMVLGENSVSWGLQFSFPQLFEDPKTGEVIKVLHPNATCNSGMFSEFRQWVRHFTKAARFSLDGKECFSPLRLGKKCFSWINTHPQFKKHKLEILNIKN
jgi:hypothetical protein